MNRRAGRAGAVVLVGVEQAAGLADRHRMWLDCRRLLDVYGRWRSDAARLSVSWDDRGWWAGVEAFGPHDRLWCARTEFVPRLGDVERLLVAAVESGRAAAEVAV